MPTRPCNLVDVGAIGSAKMALQTPAGPFSQNRLLPGLTPSSAVMNRCRRTRVAGSSAEGSPRARPAWEQRPVILKPRRSRSAGSIGLRGGSYCRRPHSARGKKEAGGSRLQICRRLKNRIANPVRLRLDKKEEKRNFTRNKNRTDYGKQRRNHPVPARQRSAAGSSSGRRDRVAQQATIVGIVRSRHKDNRQACEQCTERRIGRNFSCRKFCDNCRRRKNLPSGILQSGYDSINRL